MSRFYYLLTAFILLTTNLESQVHLLERFPHTYVAYRTTDSITMDGNLDEAAWQNVPWTDTFSDIEGDKKPAPLYRSHAKILWDDNYLYLAAELEEPNIWATYTKRNSVIFHENNFEVFIDPDGDTHHYYEYEVNALGTEWDLFLTKPYRNGGIPMSAWHISGLKKGIRLNGTINNTTDTDSCWCVELAFPWEILKECAPGRRGPKPGEQWRINFSRVEWQLEVVNGAYQKVINPATGKIYPEYNWVWSPQGVIDMHRPELWGFVQFSCMAAGSGVESFRYEPDEYIKFALRELYYRQHAFFRKNNHYTDQLSLLMPLPMEVNGKAFQADFEISKTRFKLSASSSHPGQKWYITEDGRIWKE